MAERMFPVLYQLDSLWERRRRRLQAVPWRLLEPHAKRAKRNHDQTLERLAERGGLSLSEMCALLDDRPFRTMSHDDALERVEAAIRALPPAPCSSPAMNKEADRG